MARKLSLQECKKVIRDYTIKSPLLAKHQSLQGAIEKTFASRDKIFLLKAPGRVNLIGEHTDYNMGPVLPCAINREIVFAIRPSSTPHVYVSNVEEKFSPVDFSLTRKIEPYPAGHWGNYIKAGIKGIVDYLNELTTNNTKTFKGFDIIVSSTLPQAAGVSSSSALVVASALTFVLVNNLDLNKQKIAEICAKAEHFVGTAGGGMDQAASLLGKENAFLYMRFNPLKIQTIDAPQDIQLILFNSLVQAEKSGLARREYNRRVLECKMAVDLFNHFLKKEMPNNFKDINYIGELKPELFNINQNELDIRVEIFLNSLHQSYSLADFLSKMGLSESALNARYASILKGNDQVVEPVGGFKLRSRFKHVYRECRRVAETIACLQKNDLNGLGKLINASHNSLSNEYEVSLPEVDQLVDLIRDNGALGARIMGAGFGGMVLALAEKSYKDQLVEKTKKDYYLKKTAEFDENYIFTCVTADGAGVI